MEPHLKFTLPPGQVLLPVFCMSCVGPEVCPASIFLSVDELFLSSPGFG